MWIKCVILRAHRTHLAQLQYLCSFQDICHSRNYSCNLQKSIYICYCGYSWGVLWQMNSYSTSEEIRTFHINFSGSWSWHFHINYWLLKLTLLHKYFHSLSSAMFNCSKTKVWQLYMRSGQTSTERAYNVLSQAVIKNTKIAKSK